MSEHVISLLLVFGRYEEGFVACPVLCRTYARFKRGAFNRHSTFPQMTPGRSILYYKLETSAFFEGFADIYHTELTLPCLSRLPSVRMYLSPLA